MDVSSVHRGGNFVYDPAIYGYDTTYWATMAGTPAASGSALAQKILLNADGMSSKVFYRFVDLTMFLNIPAVPTTSDSRQFGLQIPGLGNRGRVAFDITGTAFTTKIYDNVGTLVKSTAQTFDATWAAAEIPYGIRIGRDGIKFFVNDVCIYRYSVAGRDANPVVTDLAQSIYINNANADAMYVGAVVLRNISSWN